MLACSQKQFMKICFQHSAILSLRELYGAKFLGSQNLLTHVYYWFPLLVLKEEVLWVKWKEKGNSTLLSFIYSTEERERNTTILLICHFPKQEAFHPGWNSTRRLNSFLIPLAEFRGSSNVEEDGGFVNLASPFVISVCFSFEYLSKKSFVRNCLLQGLGYFIMECLNKT